MSNTTSETIPGEDKRTWAVLDRFLGKMQTWSALADTQLKHAKENQQRELETAGRAALEAMSKSVPVDSILLSAPPALTRSLIPESLSRRCNAIVTRQYLNNCKNQGVKFDVAPTLGQRLSVSPESLFQSIAIVTEAGLKLGQVRWRASCSTSVVAPDRHLGQLIFELLQREDWTLARRMGEFGAECAKRTHSPPRNERAMKVILINHAQAAKWSNDNAGAMRLLASFDWTGSAPEFRLAIA